MLNSIDELEDGGVYHYTTVNTKGETSRNMLVVLPDKTPISLYNWEEEKVYYKFMIISKADNQWTLHEDKVHLVEHECIKWLTKLS